jgi:hypothetical protein
MVWEEGTAKVLVAMSLGKDVMNKVLAATWFGQEVIKNICCSILLHSSVHRPSAKTCQFLKFKILNFKVLKVTTCFSLYGHHQV